MQGVDGRGLLVRFKDLHLEMAVAEMLALFELFGDSTISVDSADQLPFVHLRSTKYPDCIPSELCEKVCARSMLVEGFYREYALGRNYEELMANLDQDVLEKDAYAPGTSLKVNVETYGQSLTQKQKTERIFRVLSVLTDKVKVDLKNPTLHLYLFEQMRSRHNIDNELIKIYFTKYVARNSNSLALDYQLRERPFLNTTSMDPCLSFVMANCCLARPASVVFDPFVGSGSVLVSCAHFGAHVAGSDYDPRVFSGEDPSVQSVKANFAHYGFGDRFLGVIRADFSQEWTRDLDEARSVPMFDAIVTDPP